MQAKAMDERGEPYCRPEEVKDPPPRTTLNSRGEHK